MPAPPVQEWMIDHRMVELCGIMWRKGKDTKDMAINLVVPEYIAYRALQIYLRMRE